MKKAMRWVLAAVLCLGLILGVAYAAETDTPINEENFPNVNLRDYISATFDLDADGILTQEEREAVTTVSVGGMSIDSLEGIELFPNLQVLLCSNNSLTTLDVSKNTALQTLTCNNNRLTTLDLSKNTALKALTCNSNQLTALDLKNNTQLEQLHCEWNQLKGLDVSANGLLSVLNCRYNQLICLNLSSNSALTSVQAGENTCVVSMGSGRSVNLSSLSDKFDVSKAGSWSGGTAVGTVLTLSTGSDFATYSYNCGAGYTVQFTVADTARTPYLPINAANFPDAAFRTFVGQSIDTSGDGTLSLAERSAVKTINASRKNIASLQGIGHFPNLEELNCSGNKLAALDLSQNTKLTKLVCNTNQLTALDVSKNTALVELNCSGNKLAALDLSANVALTTLTCSRNELTSLNIGKCTALKTLDCGTNKLASLDVSKNVALERLLCESNKLTALDAGKNVKLVELDCAGNLLTALDVSKLTALKKLDCGSNKLTSLDLSKNTALTTFVSAGNGCDVPTKPGETFDLATLPGFDVKKASGWTGGTISGTKVTVGENAKVVTYTYACSDKHSAVFSLVMPKPPAVAISAANFPDEKFRTYIAATYDADKDGELSGEEIEAITQLDVSGKTIASLQGVEHFKYLQKLDCKNNKLTTLDMSKNLALTELNCSGNELTKVDVIKNKALTTLDCGNNKLATLDVSQNTDLTGLTCSKNQLTKLYLARNTKLTALNCSENQLAELDLSKNTGLVTLNCGSNKLTALDLSKNTELTTLNCNSNRLTSLDLSKNTKLTTGTATGNSYAIFVGSSRTFSLAKLPGFKAEKASGWTGGTVSGTTLTVNKDATAVTYSYACGNNVVLAVTLTAADGYAITGLPANTDVEIEGVVYRTDATGKLSVDSSSLTVATAYTYGQSATKDPNGQTSHQSYPTGMKVWSLTFSESKSAYTAEAVEELTNFLSYQGTSIRWSTNANVKNGIRVITSVPKTQRISLLNGTLIADSGLQGYKLVEYGTLIKRKDVAGAFVYNGNGVQSSYALRTSAGEDRQFSSTATEVRYTGAFVGLDHDLCDDELLLRSYMILEKNGQRIVIYGGTLQRNIGYVAYQNKDYKPSQAVENFIWGIIQAVYGDKVKK